MVDDVYCSCHYTRCFHLRFRTFFSEETVSCLSICTYIWPSSGLVYVVISNASKVHICHYLLQNIKICAGDHLMYVYVRKRVGVVPKTWIERKKTTAVVAAASARVSILAFMFCVSALLLSFYF